MGQPHVFDDRVSVIADLCRQGLDPDALRAEALRRIRKTVAIDALWWATADPATLFFTRAYREEIPERSAPYFVENEFLRDDVNKWVDVARELDRRADARTGDGREADTQPSLSRHLPAARSR